MSVTKTQIQDVLKTIEDPELHLGIFELGLIYEINIVPSEDGDEVSVTMTFTSPFCPYGPALKAEVQKVVESVEGVSKAMIIIVFTPPWDPRTMASENCKVALGLGWDTSDDFNGGEGIEAER